jgi:putative endonuclease
MITTQNSNTELGRIGEEKAINFLKEKGYHILAQNYRYRKDEIDIIAQLGKLLVFVEVKARKNNYYGYPEEFVNKSKARNVIRAAQNYIITKNWVAKIRFDIIAITGNDLVHFEDAFY